MNVLINNKPATFNASDFPILISSREGLGASRFTICLMLDLFRQGHKILLFSAFPAAKEDFKEMLTAEELEEVESVNPSDAILGKKAILVNSGEETALIKVLNSLKDKHERIVLVKNIEQYSQTLFDVVTGLPIVILSGDTDKCQAIEWLKQRDFVTKIFFSKPEQLPVTNFPVLEKYQGVTIGKNHNGPVSLEQ